MSVWGWKGAGGGGVYRHPGLRGLVGAEGGRRPNPGGVGGAALRSPTLPALTRFSTRRLAPSQPPAGPTKPLCAGRAGGRPAGLTPTRAAAGHGPAGTRAVCGGAPPPSPRARPLKG